MNELTVYNPPASIPRAETISNFVQEFLAIRCKGLGWQAAGDYRLVLEEFEIFINNRPLTRQLMIDWMQVIEKKGLSAVRYNRWLDRTRCFLKWCEFHELLKDPPYKFLTRKPKQERPLPAIVTEEEYEKVKEATKGTVYYYLTVLGYRAGMSFIDACFLRWDSVDLDNLFIEASRIKMARLCRSHTFKIPILAGGDLHLMLKEMSDNRVVKYGNDYDNYVNPYMASWYKLQGHKRMGMRFIGIFKKLGIKGKSFKNFRNTLLSHLANSGANMAIACQISGHSDPKTFMGYVKPDPNALRETMMKAQQWAETQELKRKK